MAHMGPISCQFDEWNCQVFLNIQKWKIMFKIRKDYLRIILFLMETKDLCFKLSKLTSIQDLENNNWIILGFIWNNFDTVRELVQNSITRFLLEFISNNTETFREILSTLFVRVHIKQYWHSRRVTTNQC